MQIVVQSLGIIEKPASTGGLCGSRDWIRTSNRPINSRESVVLIRLCSTTSPGDRKVLVRCVRSRVMVRVTNM